MTDYYFFITAYTSVRDGLTRLMITSIHWRLLLPYHPCHLHLHLAYNSTVLLAWSFIIASWFALAKQAARHKCHPWFATISSYTFLSTFSAFSTSSSTPSNSQSCFRLPATFLSPLSARGLGGVQFARPHGSSFASANRPWPYTATHISCAPFSLLSKVPLWSRSKLDQSTSVLVASQHP